MDSQKQPYSHTSEDIPLYKVLTEEKHDDCLMLEDTLQGDDKRQPDYDVHKLKKSKTFLYLKPLPLFCISSFFIIALLLLLLHANGKSIEYTIIGLKIPAIVSLLLNITTLFIISGVSTAIAEYKWVHLKKGAELTLIDVYDGCTRGLSGFSLTIRAMHFDFVLLVAFLFHLGILVYNPLTQEVLVPMTSSYNKTGIDVRFFAYKPYYIEDRGELKSSGMPPKMNGLTKNAYITTSSFAQAANGSPASPLFKCPSGSDYCIFNNVSYISTTMTCNQVTENDTAIVNRWGTNRTVVVLKEYFTFDNITHNSEGKKMVFPKFLYATEMLGRTYYDLLNYTAPLMPGLNIPMIFASTTEYDPQYRPYVGDQVFVVAYRNSDIAYGVASNYTELTFKKCHFNSSLVLSTWKTSNGTLVQASVDTTTPIVMDYDNVLGNNVALAPDQLLKNKSTSVMVNAYIMQQALLVELTTPKYYSMADYMSAYNINNPDPKFELFMKDALIAFDYAFFQAPYVSQDFASLDVSPYEGLAFFTTTPTYSVSKLGAYALCLCLFLPVIWWVCVWFISMKETEGIARGNSQIALLATGMTPLAETQLHEFSYLGSSNAFKSAKNIRIRIGIFKKNQKKRVTFGIEGEENLYPLKNQ